MEYEIQDQGEEQLMDESTNPSLDPDAPPPVKQKPKAGPNAGKADSEELQKAELIPEEEQPS